MLKSRLITAAFLIFGFLLAIFYASTLAWALICLSFTLVGAYEWTRLIKLSPSQTIIHLLFATLLGLLVVYCFNTPYTQLTENYLLVMLALAVIAWVVAVPLILNDRLNHQYVRMIIGLVILSGNLIAFIGLHKIAPLLLLGVIATVSLADSAAYFGGKRFGRRKLAPTISPGKTWEGVATALVVVSIYALFLNGYLQYSTWLVLGLMCLVMLSVVGDLFESKLKRQANLKDSGNILPGHGGVLDRIDGMVPTTTFMLFYIYLPLYLSNGLPI